MFTVIKFIIAYFVFLSGIRNGQHENMCYRTVDLLAVWYVRQKLSFTLSKERRLSVLRTVLRRIFLSLKEEIRGGWKRLRNDKFHNLHSSPNIFMMIELGR
jgi:hypothetical protein